MMLLRIDKTLNPSFALAIFLTAFLAHVLQTCHKHKNTIAPSQMLLQMQAQKLDTNVWGHKQILIYM